MQVYFDGTVLGLQAHGGVSRYLRALLMELRYTEPRLRMTLLAGAPARQEVPQIEGMIRVDYRLPAAPAWRPERWTRSLRAYWSEVAFRRSLAEASSDFDRSTIWHTPFYRVPSNWSGPVVVTAHDLASFRFPDLYGSAHARRFRERQQDCYRRADRILAVSESTRADLIEILGVEEGRIRVTPHRCPQRWVPSADAVADGPFVLSVGNRSAIKNIDVLFEGFSRFQLLEVKLLVVGPPASAAEMDRIQGLGLQSRVRFLGPIDDAQLSRLYEDAAAFVYPSLYEGFGLPLLEAMNAGCPVVASDIPTSHEVAGEAAIYFETRSAEDLARALTQVVEDGRDHSRCQLGRARASLFDGVAAVETTLETYRSLT